MGVLQTRILEWVDVLSSGFFPTQGWNPGLHPLQADSLLSEPLGRLRNTGVGSYPFSSRSSWPRNQTRISCIAGRLFTIWATREAQLSTDSWSEQPQHSLNPKSNPEQGPTPLNTVKAGRGEEVAVEKFETAETGSLGLRKATVSLT